MGEYANVKRKIMVRFLKWLGCKQNIAIKSGKHQYVVRYAFWDRPYPVPTRHGEIDQNIVKALVEKLVSSEICTKEEFDKRIK